MVIFGFEMANSSLPSPKKKKKKKKELLMENLKIHCQFHSAEVTSWTPVLARLRLL